MNNVTLIGMPGSGKSTIGVILAKALRYEFLDSDLLIQKQEKRKLSEIIEQDGPEKFKEIENQVNADIHVTDTVIAPGGSVIYCDEAMEHLKSIGKVIYLKLSLESLSKRLGNLKGRGVLLKDGQSLKDLYEERVPLYEKYADIVIDEEGKTAGETVDELRNVIEGMMDQKMIQMFIDEQKRKLEERDRLLSEKDEEIRKLKARVAELEGR